MSCKGLIHKGFYLHPIIYRKILWFNLTYRTESCTYLLGLSGVQAILKFARKLQ